jgi:hypothetical protein
MNNEEFDESYSRSLICVLGRESSIKLNEFENE